MEQARRKERDSRLARAVGKMEAADPLPTVLALFGSSDGCAVNGATYGVTVVMGESVTWSQCMPRACNQHACNQHVPACCPQSILLPLARRRYV